MNKQEKIEKVQETLLLMAKELEEYGADKEQNFSCLADLAVEGNRVQSYCALGVLGCKHNMIYVEKDETADLEWDDEFNLKQPTEEQIIHYYGLKDRMKKPFTIMYRYAGKENGTLNVITEEDISTIITSLNDDGHFSFNEIARVLKNLAYNHAEYVSLAPKKLVAEAKAKVRQQND